MRPVTSACALMVFQFANCGALSIPVMRSIKAAGSIGANSPLRLRLLAMTPATSAPTCASAGDPGKKLGMAIGNGATLPSGITSLVCALAAEGSNKPAAAPALLIRSSRRSRRSGGSGNEVMDIAGSSFRTSAVKHLLRIEIDVHVFPLVVGLVSQHCVWLALKHGAHCRFGRSLVARRPPGRNHLRRPGQPAIGI